MIQWFFFNYMISNYEIQFQFLLTQMKNNQIESEEEMKKRNTRRILEGSLAAAEEGEERQSATARRKGSGNFFTDEDLNLETAPINCGGVKDIGFDSIRVGSKTVITRNESEKWKIAYK